jgi:protein SCO1
MQATGGHIRQKLWIEKLVLNPFFWFVACGFFFAYPMLKSMKRELPVELPVLHQLPSFEFVNEDGKLFGDRDLYGKVYIVNLICTRCEVASEAYFKKLQTLQHRLRGVIDRAAIVSLSIDPAVDTAPVLYNKARELKSNPNVWKFLSAPRAQTESWIASLKMPIELETDLMGMMKREMFVLVDQEGNVRGYYDSDNEGMNRMMIDTGLLINRKKNS